MKIVIMNTVDIEGGAARCAYRLHKGLQSCGADSIYIVQNKFSADEDVLTCRTKLSKLFAVVRAQLDIIPTRLYRHRLNSYFSTGLMTRFDASSVNSLVPDIINLHWVAEGFLPIMSLKQFKRPIVWTLHDSWPFTGGCHLPGDCKRYQQSCGACPMLCSKSQYDLSYFIWRKKSRSWHDLNMTIVTGGTWLAECVKNSSLFRNCRVETINPGLDLMRYKPIEKTIARSLLSLPVDKKLILFGAMNSTGDSNKGFQFLQPAIQRLSKTSFGAAQAELVIFGVSKSSNSPDLGMKTHYMGRFHDDISLALLYSAADVMVVPSIRESFGQTASEAMACGTPVVAFGATGLLDIVDHKQNGYSAVPYEPTDLANGIAWVLSLDEAGRKSLSLNARSKAEKAFSIESMAQKYLALFNDLINTRHD